jgi:hypothetical protein
VFVLALALPLVLAQIASDAASQIVVPVTVADSSGRAVVGLDQGSFKVAVEGRPRELAAFAVSEAVDAYIVFAPDVAERWRNIREKVVGALQENSPVDNVTVVLSQEESAPEDEPANTVRLPELQRRYVTGGDELAEIISLGFESMKGLSTRAGRRRAIFVVLSSPPETFRRSRRRLLEKAAQNDIQVFAPWRSRREYAEYEGRSMKAARRLDRTDRVRSAQFTDPEEIPGIVMQFSTAAPSV